MDAKTTMPPAVAAAFAARPEATLAMHHIDMGHGYNKAKWGGQCKLTNDHIVVGEVIRNVVVWTRDGRRFDGYVSNRAVGYLFGARCYEYTDADENTSTVAFAVHHKCSSGWEAALADATPGDSLHLIQRTNHHHTHVSYALSASSGWHGPKRSTLSTKQLQANIRRSKRNILWHLEG